MIDRESTLADPQIVEMLKTQFVPVAFDQWYQRRQKDVEGRLYQRIALQEHKNLNNTTQGFYIATAAGQLIAYDNHRGPDRIRRLMKSALAKRVDLSAEALDLQELDKRMVHEVPDGAVVVQVNSKVLGGYGRPRDKHNAIVQRAIGRDNFWILASELATLKTGQLPESLARRMCQFHLNDNTRGEPKLWSADELVKCDLKLKDGIVSGQVQLQTSDKSLSYDCFVYGRIEWNDNQLSRFDLVARGDHVGQGPWTWGAPSGQFPLAVAFRLASPEDIAYSVRPQAIKGFGWDYLK